MIVAMCCKSIGRFSFVAVRITRATYQPYGISSFFLYFLLRDAL